jgi:ferritin-like protein
MDELTREMCAAQAMLDRLNGLDDPISRAIREEATERLYDLAIRLRIVASELHELAACEGDALPANGVLAST